MEAARDGARARAWAWVVRRGGSGGGRVSSAQAPQEEGGGGVGRRGGWRGEVCMGGEVRWWG